MQKKKYNVFISYSHSMDREVAVGLQRWLQKFAKPWYKLRAIRVFRDETDLGATPDGWKSIQSALNQSDFFILMASREAAKSKWVKREIQYWLSFNTSEKLEKKFLDQPLQKVNPKKLQNFLIVHTDGNIKWLDSAEDADGYGNFDWNKTDALPSNLSGVFTREPFWVSLKESVQKSDLNKSLSRSNPDFMAAVAKLSAPIRKLEMNKLISNDHRQHKQKMITAWSAGLSLFFLSLFLGFAIYFTSILSNVAQKEKQFAEAGELLAQSQTIIVSQMGDLAEAAKLSLNAHQIYVNTNQSVVAPQWFKKALGIFISEGPIQIEDEHKLLTGKPRRRSFIQRASRILSIDETSAYVEQREISGSIFKLCNDLLAKRSHAMVQLKAPLVKYAGFTNNDTILFSIQKRNVLDLWSANTGESLNKINLGSIGSSVNGESHLAISGSGQWIATADRNLKISLRSLSTGMVKQVIDAKKYINEYQTEEVGDTSTVSAIALNHDGLYLALVMADTRAYVFRLNSEESSSENIEVQEARIISSKKFRVHFYPDDNNIRVKKLSLSSDGVSLAISSSSIRNNKGQVIVYNTGTGDRAYAPLTHDGMVNGVVFSRNNKLLATAGQDGVLRLWNNNSGERVRSINIGGDLLDVAFDKSKNPQFVATGGMNGLANVWDIRTGRELTRINQEGNIYSINFDKLGRRLITGAGLPGIGSDTNATRIWDLEHTESIVQAKINHNTGVNSLELSPNGKILVTAEFYDEISIWDTESGQNIKSLPRGSGLTENLTMDENCDSIVSLSYEKNELAKVWKRNNNSHYEIPGPGFSRVNVEGVPTFMTQATFAKKGTYLARSIMNKNIDSSFIEIWDLKKRKKIWEHRVEKGISSLATSDKGDLITWTIGNKDSLTLYVSDTKTVMQIKQISIPLEEVQYSRVLSSFDSSGTLLLLTNRGTKDFKTIDIESMEIKSFATTQSKITGATIHPNGLKVAISTEDQRVQVYDLVTKTYIAHFEYESNNKDAQLRFDPVSPYLYGCFGDNNPNLPSIWRWLWEEEELINKVKNRISL